MKRRTDWALITAEYQRRTCTQEEFCKRHGINAGALQYHLRMVMRIFSSIGAARWRKFCGGIEPAGVFCSSDSLLQSSGCLRKPSFESCRRLAADFSSTAYSSYGNAKCAIR